MRGNGKGERKIKEKKTINKTELEETKKKVTLHSVYNERKWKMREKKVKEYRK